MSREGIISFQTPKFLSVFNLKNLIGFQKPAFKSLILSDLKSQSYQFLKARINNDFQIIIGFQKPKFMYQDRKLYIIFLFPIFFNQFSNPETFIIFQKPKLFSFEKPEFLMIFKFHLKNVRN